GAGRPRRIAPRGSCATTIGQGSLAMRPRDWATRIPWRQVKLWQLYLLGGAAFTALYALVPPFKGNAPLINLLGLSGVFAVLVGARRNRPRTRVAWWLCALGLFMFWLGV